MLHQVGHRGALRPLLGRSFPRGSTDDDVLRFRHFVRFFTRPRIGAFSLHFWVNYIDLGRRVECATREDPNSTDTCVRLRDPPEQHSSLLGQVEKDLGAMLRHRVRLERRERSKRTSSGRRSPRVSAASHAHDVACWTRQEDLFHSLNHCLSACEETLGTKAVDWAMLRSTQNTISNPSTQRVANAVLYDRATRGLVASRDRQMFSFFGYDVNDTTANDRRLWVARAKTALEEEAHDEERRSS